jgi:hypothetical protein
VLHGVPAVASLLGERAGRFTLNAEQAPIDPDLTGSLHQQIAACVSRSRGAASSPRITVAAAAPAPPSIPPVPRPPPVVDIPVEVAPLVAEVPREATVRTLPITPRPFVPAFVPRMVTVTPRAHVERTLPLARPVVAALPIHRPSVAPAAAPEPRMRRSWGVPLRWVGVAAVAALGLVLGAGVRALRQTPSSTPTTAAPQH